MSTNLMVAIGMVVVLAIFVIIVVAGNRNNKVNVFIKEEELQGMTKDFEARAAEMFAQAEKHLEEAERQLDIAQILGGESPTDEHGMSEKPTEFSMAQQSPEVLQQQQIVSELLTELWNHREAAGKPVPITSVRWAPALNKFNIDTEAMASVYPDASYYFVDLEAPPEYTLQGIVVPFDSGKQHVVAITSNGLSAIMCPTQELTPEILLNILTSTAKPLTH